MVEYTYNAWGEMLGITGTLKDTIGQKNPLRYRGYYFDSETGFYYLQSRYYDPIVQRFLNADGLLSTGQGMLGYNMFAYCGNNPISYCDPSGKFPWLIVGIIALSTIGGGIIGALSDKKLYEVPKENSISKKPNKSSTKDVEPKIKSTAPKITQPNKPNVQEPISDANEKLTVGDRIVNTLIGASLGLATGGAIVATMGAVGVVAVGSLTTNIAVLGASGSQTFAIGALAYDAFAIIIAPFLGLEAEPIEYAP